MKRFAVILMWLVASSVSLAQPPAMIDAYERSIINGTRTPRSIGLETSEILAIGAITNFEDPSSAFCTGTVITNRVVVTAAHCIVRPNGSARTAQDISFVIGENPTIDGRLFDVSQVAVHPEYIANSDDPQMADVAVLLLASDVSAEAPELIPIEFNRHPLIGLDADALLNRTVEIAGYGVTQKDNVGNASSASGGGGRFFTSLELVAINELTVLIDGKGQSGACEGDSGGPLITLNMRQAPVIVGVLRGGSLDCVGRDHYVRLDVATIRNWLENQIMRTWPTYPEGSVCGPLSFYGRCVADHVEYCGADFRVIRQDCLESASASTCSFLNLDDGYACRPLRTCSTASCSSRFDGFLPPAPLSIVNVGGCQSQSRGWLSSAWFFLLLLGIRRRC